jgi:hypothetical protein
MNFDVISNESQNNTLIPRWNSAIVSTPVLLLSRTENKRSAIIPGTG